ncbi:hypothetical protein OPT61_g4239 [Boeremia exigua]|uniref:Uncharacterized protein n=1 Tax=Boeremia exigua TaxID=749465 RepID=A0ACC2IEW9_9PLEO|nr:hypothetical protein OPT61_g4239 [Boeremia exigua]
MKQRGRAISAKEDEPAASDLAPTIPTLPPPSKWPAYVPSQTLASKKKHVVIVDCHPSRVELPPDDAICGYTRLGLHLLAIRALSFRAPGYRAQLAAQEGIGGMCRYCSSLSTYQSEPWHSPSKERDVATVSKEVCLLRKASVDRTYAVSQVKSRPRASLRTRARKKWPEEFSQVRPFVDRRFFEDRNVIVEKDTDLLEKFNVDFESSIPSWDISVLRKFCRIQTAFKSDFWRRSRAKLDGRSCSTKLQREYPDWLTPAELQHHLSVERFDNAEHPDTDVDRQLVYIYRLCPQYISGLMSAVYSHQQSALRDTIWQHISREASIRVKIPTNGFKTYLLEFHMPFLTFRCATNSAAAPTRDAVGSDDETESIAIVLHCEEHERPCKFVVRESNVSIALCGWDRQKWTCWTFSNTLSDPTARNEEEPEEIDMQEDYIATDGNGLTDGIVVDAAKPILDAREYWLCVVDIRMRIIYSEWEWVIKNADARVKDWKRKNPLLFHANAPGNQQREKAEELLLGMLQNKELLRLLSDKLAMTLQACTRFERDKYYFMDIENERVHSTLDSLHETFEALADLQNTLARLEQECDKTEHIVGSRLTFGVDANLSKIGLLQTYVSNRLNSEAQKVNIDTNRASQKMAELNRRGTEAAVKSSQITRINVQLFLVTTPFILALQYFGAEKDIFSFERNPRNFSYAICVLFITLPVLTYVLSSLNLYWEMLLSRICGKKGTNTDEESPVELEELPRSAVSY